MRNLMLKASAWAQTRYTARRRRPDSPGIRARGGRYFRRSDRLVLGFGTAAVSKAPKKLLRRLLVESHHYERPRPQHRSFEPGYGGSKARNKTGPAILAFPSLRTVEFGSGQTVIEYALVAAFVSIVVLGLLFHHDVYGRNQA